MAMKRNCSKLISLCLALCMMLSLAICANAAEIDTSGGSGTTPVSLTTTNGGIGGGDDGDITPTKLNVTVPTTLPLAMSDEGTVITATDCKITNNSKTGAVQVTAISMTDGTYKVGNYDSFSGSKTIALKINSCVTKDAGKMSITKDALPKIGAAQNLPLTYFAKVSGDAPNSKDVQAANVVFTISIVG